MFDSTRRWRRRPATALLSIMLAALSGASLAQAPIIQPGAPGQPSRQLSAEEAIALAVVRFSADDARFMQDMIPHHAQALEMSALVPERTARSEMIELARRIEASQKDEIEFMQGWLRERGLDVPEPGSAMHEHAGHAGHGGHGDHGRHAHAHHTMEGMATPEQMAALEAARADAFDAMFLELMIVHHQGALTMVEALLAAEGSAGEPALLEFTTHLTNDQQAEIERMTAMLTGFSPDPRASLAAGFRNGGEALSNMALLASLPKPPGFFDPDNPASLPPDRLAALAAGEQESPAEADTAGDGDKTAGKAGQDKPGNRAPPLDFAHTDMAFSGNLLAVGSYHGFNLYDLSSELPELVSSVVCPGGQGDVSIVGNLLILSVEQQRGRLDCGLKGAAGKVNAERFRGLRIFDLSDPAKPVQVGAVQTCRGSHTHTVVAGPGEDRRLIVYNSGIGPVRDGEELEGCLDASPWRDERTALFRIDVIEIPVDRPAESRIIDSPAVFTDPVTGAIAGLWDKGDHGPRTQTTSETNHCHDITVFPELGIAAGACSGNGILFDISDPLKPKRIHEVVDPGFAYWHSATFSNDGTKVIFTDEWGGGTRPRCRASDPRTWGANAIYDIVDRKLVFRSYYKLPAPQGEMENCVAHNGSLVPVPGRDIMVQAWYQGGISVFDFTDSSAPVEIAYFDRGPIDAEALVIGGFWSAYWYQGLVYGTEIVRGLDVLSLAPSEFLSESEISAAALAFSGSTLNPQTQQRVRWPAEPMVARAYQDQLLRAGRLAPADSARLIDALARGELQLERGGPDPALAEELLSLAGDMAGLGRNEDAVTRARLRGIGTVLEGLAGRMD